MNPCGSQHSTKAQCDVCDALAQAHHAIHVQTTLAEAWNRVKADPIVKSMHSDAQERIRRAIAGL